MSSLTRFELRTKVLQEKSWYHPVTMTKNRWQKKKSVRSRLSKGQRRFVRKKMAQERSDQIRRDQEERVRARTIEVPKKSLSLVLTTKPTATKADQPISLSENFRGAMRPTDPWVCHATMRGAVLSSITCYQRNPAYARRCSSCNAPRPGV
jgi:hypothetical protein